jgi:hypothetical protein
MFDVYHHNKRFIEILNRLKKPTSTRKQSQVGKYYEN